MESEFIKNAGIYKLTCVKNNKVYIGKSIDLSRRLNTHKNTKKRNIMSYLQNSIIKHGWDSFDVEILEIFEDFDKLEDNMRLLERESYYIDLYESTNSDIGYNICSYSNDVTGRVLSEEHKYKISESSKGREFSDEHKLNLSRSATGRILTDETKQRMSDGKRGKPSPRKGAKLSDELKEKLSQIKKGKPSNRRGVILSEETKTKMRASHLKNKQNKRNG